MPGTPGEARTIGCPFFGRRRAACPSRSCDRCLVLLRYDRQPNQEDQPDGDRPFLLDGAVFQDRGAWGAYWHAILEDWRASGFSERMIVLERVGTAPRIPGLRYRALPAYRVEEAGRDAARLERVARRAAAQAVLTAVPTAAVETPLVAVVLALEWWLPASAAELAAAELCLAGEHHLGR